MPATDICAATDSLPRLTSLLTGHSALILSACPGDSLSLPTLRALAEEISAMGRRTVILWADSEDEEVVDA